MPMICSGQGYVTCEAEPVQSVVGHETRPEEFKVAMSTGVVIGIVIAAIVVVAAVAWAYVQRHRSERLRA